MNPETTHRTDLALGKQPAVLAGAILPGAAPRGENPLDELESLATTAGAVPVGRLTQRLRKPKPFAGTYLGRGKLLELRDLVIDRGARVVIFNQDLSPAQVKNIEEIVKVQVLDRTELILAIFAARARTRQAHIQVELAQLKYALPRLRRKWTHLERQVGGIGVRAGPGERQLETDRRVMHKQIANLQRELRVIARRTERRVRARDDCFNVSLIGYTNTGKSTLLNALTGARAFVEDRLFATLDTKTRRLELPGGHRVLVSDTVGFIRQLPHHLIASFHATLEETLAADLLLHVADASHPGCEAQIEAVNDVLKSIGAERQPVIVIFNKVDRLDPNRWAEIRVIMERYAGSLAISAKTGEGLDQLKHELLAADSKGTREVALSLPAADGAAFSFLSRHAFVIERRYNNDRAELRLLITPSNLEILTGRHRDVRVTDSESPARDRTVPG